MNNYEFIRFDVAEHIATVRIDRPPVNAGAMELYREIVAVFEEINNSGDDIRVAILTGTGRYFCAGRDVKMAPSQEPPMKRHAAAREAYGAILHCAVPVIGAI